MTEPRPIRGWVEIGLEGPVFILEAVSDFLNALGSGGAIFSEAKKHRRPGYERLTGFFANDRRLPGRMAKLEKYVLSLPALFPLQPISKLQIQAIADEDWINRWRETIVPTKVSEKFWVAPEWQKAPAEAEAPGSQVIIMEPGLAFGTGFHPSTKLCLEIIEELAPEKGRGVLDVGTGTGILAMAAAMLGAKEVLAVDNDPLALRVAEDNLKRNGLLGKVKLVKAGNKTNQRLSKKKFDLIVANLFLGELKRLAQYLVAHLAPGGLLAVSGILPHQSAEVVKAYKKLGLQIIKKKEKQGWLLILMKKK